jgi:hypothetical protein
MVSRPLLTLIAVMTPASCALVAGLEDHELDRRVDASFKPQDATFIVPDTYEAPLGEATAIARNQRGPRGIATDGVKVYWANEDEQVVRALVIAVVDAGASDAAASDGDAAPGPPPIPTVDASTGTGSGVEAGAAAVADETGTMVIARDLPGVRKIGLTSTEVVAFHGGGGGAQCFVSVAAKDGSTKRCVARQDGTAKESWVNVLGAMKRGGLALLSLEDQSKSTNIRLVDTSQTDALVGTLTSLFYTAPTSVTALAADTNGDGFAAALDNGQLIYANPTAGILAQQMNKLTSMVMDAANIYWTTADGLVGRTAIEGATHEPITLAKDQKNPRGITLDGQYVVWANADDGTIRQVSKAGGPTLLLAKGQKGPWGIATAPSAIYWTNADDGTVMRLPR